MIFDWIEEIEAQIRQEALIQRLGQVRCAWASEGDYEEGHLYATCPGCRAEV